MSIQLLQTLKISDTVSESALIVNTYIHTNCHACIIFEPKTDALLTTSSSQPVSHRDKGKLPKLLYFSVFVFEPKVNFGRMRERLL